MFVINFYSHAPCGARPNVRPRGIVVEVFLLTRPLRGATPANCALNFKIAYFYSHAPCGARPRACSTVPRGFQFLLTRPLRGATSLLSPFFCKLKFLLTRPLRGATLPRPISMKCSVISTHTPLAGRDFEKRAAEIVKNNFYSHAPCGARPAVSFAALASEDFYSHAPCGARHGWTEVKVTQYHFYSHAPCGARHQRLCS